MNSNIKEDQRSQLELLVVHHQQSISNIESLPSIPIPSFRKPISSRFISTTMTTSIETSAQPKVWLITGTSSGLGFSLARYLLGIPSNRVIATSRNPSPNNPNLALLSSLGATLLPLDQNLPQETVTEQVKGALAVYGYVDVVVLNAAYVMFGTFEERTHEEILSQFETNVFGPVKIVRAVLPSMRERRTGIIVNVGSIGSVGDGPSTGIYDSSKAVVKCFSLTLDNEIKHLGLRSILVEPGFFRTSLLSKSTTTSPTAGAVVFPETKISAYKELNDQVTAFYKEKDQNQLGDPEKGAQVLVDVLEGRYNEKIGVKEIPRWILLGSDAVEWWKGVNNGYVDEVEKWEKVSALTDGKWE